MTVVADGIAAAREDSPHDSEAVATVRDLHVGLYRSTRRLPVLRGVDLTIGSNEIVGLVGESGSGKSVLGQSILGMLPAKSRPAVSGTIEVCGVDMVNATERRRRQHRATVMGAVFQDPMVSLDPTMRIGKQVMEATRGDRQDAQRLLDLARIPDSALRMRAFPHELSGGLRQRVMIAIAIARNPSLIVADEPTTALDVSVQAQILDLVLELRRETDTSFLLITHDLAAASRVCDRVAVMYKGQIVETGPTAEVMQSPSHPYTSALFSARIDLGSDPSRPLPVMWRPSNPNSGGDSESDAAANSTDGAESEVAPWPPSHRTRNPALLLHDVTKSFQVRTSRRKPDTAQVLRGISIDVREGESLAIVGESGCGKSTLLRIAAGLLEPDSGTVDLPRNARVQMVFQDAGASLTPWLTVGDQIADCLQAAGVPRSERPGEIRSLLERVGLPAEAGTMLPRQLSGGQKQRAAIARAVASRPSVLLCDEPTSALDASIAAVVLNLIGFLRRDLGIAVVFVTHDLAAARLVADRVAVMYLGRVVEIGPSGAVTEDPQHPYTQGLLSSLPESGRWDERLQGDPASPSAIPSGCSFHPRCPVSVDECADADQTLREVEFLRSVACTVVAHDRAAG